MQFNFFATDNDLLTLWRWMFDVPGMRLLESYSEPDQDNRWFDDWDEIERRVGAGHRGVTAWPSNVGGNPRWQKITFNPETQRKLNAKGRTVLHSPAFIDYIWLGEQNGCLGASSLICWSEKGANQRSVIPDDLLAEVDWKQLRSVFGKIQRQIRKSANHKLYAAPIMPDAWAKLEDGSLKLWGWGNPVDATSPLLLPV